jgi:chaperonin cofactor prefoldin
MSARSNKRRFLRTKAQNLVAHLRVGDRSIQAPVEDISMGGMLARTIESLPIGTAVMFDLARPGLKKPLRLLGVVVDTRVGRGLGIRFDGLDKESSERLEDLIGDLGGMTTSLLVDKPESELTPLRPTQQLPHAQAAPMASPFGVPTPTGSYVMVGGSTRVVQPVAQPVAQPQPLPKANVVAMPQMPSENELKLQAQVRSMVMELGRLQELVQQREKELHDARTEIARLRADAGVGDTAQRVVGKLELEKSKLKAQLLDTRSRTQREVETIQREAESAAIALGRMIDALKRMR